jgi:hypothetical protein
MTLYTEIIIWFTFTKTLKRSTLHLAFKFQSTSFSFITRPRWRSAESFLLYLTVLMWWVQDRTRNVNVTKRKRLKFYTQNLTLWSGSSSKKLLNIQPVAQRKQNLTITKTGWSTLSKETTDYYGNHTHKFKFINSKCRPTNYQTRWYLQLPLGFKGIIKKEQPWIINTQTRIINISKFVCIW